MIHFPSLEGECLMSKPTFLMLRKQVSDNLEKKWCFVITIFIMELKNIVILVLEIDVMYDNILQ